MNLFLLCERLRISKLFIVPVFAVHGEASYGRSIQEALPIEQALLPPAPFRDWSDAREEDEAGGQHLVDCSLDFAWETSYSSQHHEECSEDIG